MTLRNLRVAYLAGQDDLEESELRDSVRFLTEAGARVDLIGCDGGEVCVYRRDAEGTTEKVSIQADKKLDEVRPASYDALALPGSVLETERIPASAEVRDFVRQMKSAGKPIVCLEGRKTAPSAARGRARFDVLRMLSDSFTNWNAINAPRLGAALAYYTVLSLAPLLIILVGVAGLVFSAKTVEAAILDQVRELIGSRGADAVRGMMESTRQPGTGIVASALGILALFFGASGVFLELRNSLNSVWGVKPDYGSTLRSLIRERSFAFLMVLGTGFLLMVSLAMNAFLVAAGQFLASILPIPPFVLYLCTLAVSFGVITLLFALIYKVIPDARIGWEDVWIGAAVTSLLFTLGKAVIGLYLAKATVGSAYGAAGSLVVILVWVYYSVQVFLFGAEFTHVYSERHGSRAKRKPARAWAPPTPSKRRA